MTGCAVAFVLLYSYTVRQKRRRPLQPSGIFYYLRQLLKDLNHVHYTGSSRPKKTKAQRSERLKLAKNPWEAWDEVREFSRNGRDTVLPEWTGLYFKWWGVYTQGDGKGVTGGANGEGKATEYFMMRIGLPNGLLSSHRDSVSSASSP